MKKGPSRSITRSSRMHRPERFPFDYLIRQVLVSTIIVRINEQPIAHEAKFLDRAVPEVSQYTGVGGREAVGALERSHGTAPDFSGSSEESGPPLTYRNALTQLAPA